MIELIQCMKIDAGESDETIDERTSENNGILREYEAAIEELKHKAFRRRENKEGN